MNSRGSLIVLEGSDGSGKGTQFSLLSERLKAVGYDVAVFDFPQYEKQSSYFVRRYLEGKYGPAADISPYTASLFYALDRYEASKDIEQALAAGKIVLCNRYVGANMAHQGGKFTDQAEQRGFFVWADNLEFELLKIPRPDINLFLRVPAEVSRKMIAQRAEKTGKALDEHEKDENHLRQALKTYDALCQLFPKDFTAIECTKNGQMLSIPEVSNLIWQKITPLLPAEKPHSGHPAVVKLGGGDDPAGKKSSISAGGDRLEHEFKDASLYLKLQVERQIHSVEPAGFSVWSDNNYGFYTPQGLPKNIEGQYKQLLQEIAGLHRQMRRKLEVYYERSITSGQALPNISQLLLPVTPLAAICSFKASLSPKSVKRLAPQLLAGDSAESQWTAQQIYLAAKKQWPDQFRQPLESEEPPTPLNTIISKLADEKLSLNSADTQPVSLVSAAPRLEFDLLAESVYPYSSLSLEEIIEEVSEWSYQQKYDALKQAAAEPHLLLEKIDYKFDLISDHIVLNEISALVGPAPGLSQNPSPRNGYDVPEILEEVGIDEQYIACFDASLKLFSLLQQIDRDDLTIYAVLLGHKLRWQLNANAYELKNIIEHRDGENYRALISQLQEKAAEAHPLIWSIISAEPPAPGSGPRKNRVKPSRQRHSRKRK